ncbi:MAG: DNA-3-methyladenine glycosylase I [bacterium]|nr:DNA-3-methyladenine glycosylase I [bacterium]
MTVARQIKRCSWAGEDPLYVAYHDEEWGVPQRDENRLFEKLTLEGAQAGLSWITILRKRDAYRKAFSGFDPAKIARFDRRKIERLMNNEGIVRNRLKIESAIKNARVVLKIQDEHGGLVPFLWGFVGGKTKVNRFKTMQDLPAKTAQSEALSRELRRRGMNFVGPTICYALMQATGMVNDHVTSCFRWKQLR